MIWCIQRHAHQTLRVSIFCKRLVMQLLGPVKNCSGVCVKRRTLLQALAAASALQRTHESDSGLSPYHARRPVLAAVELDEDSERGLSGTHRQRKYRRTAVAIAAQKREHAAQA